jgi:ABC-type nitrate/sulfonate/bicarbonate transport system substrate-binding protein
MSKSKGLSRRQALATIGAGVLAGAAGSLALPGRASAQGKLEKMSIFMGTTPQFSSVVVAQEGGYFKKYGLDTEITVFASGSVATEAFLAGKGSVVVSGDMPALKLWTKGLVGICPQASYTDLSIVVAKKELTKADQIKRKKLGVLMGSTSEYFAGLFLKSGGLTMNDVDVINLQPAEMVTGLASGDIDGFVIWQPFGWRAVEAIKDAHVVTTAAPFFHEYQAVTSTKEYAGSHNGELVAFIKGLREAGMWTKANVDEASKMVAKFLRMDKPDLAKQMIEVIDFSLAYTPAFRKDMDALANFAKLKIDWATMFDPRFLKEVDPALVQM